MTNFTFDGPKNSSFLIVLAHGAGAPMDSHFMTFFAKGLAMHDYRVARFEFPYMVKRRITGKKHPPNKPKLLLETWLEVINELGTEKLIIGGKSMGGRFASMVADEAGVRGLIRLGYPFHPTSRPDKLRIDHLRRLQTPSLFLQGDRDRLGHIDNVANYRLSHNIRLKWLEDGDHGFKPRKKSGRTEKQNWKDALDALICFTKNLQASKHGQ